MRASARARSRSRVGDRDANWLQASQPKLGIETEVGVEVGTEEEVEVEESVETKTRKMNKLDEDRVSWVEIGRVWLKSAARRYYRTS